MFLVAIPLVWMDWCTCIEPITTTSFQTRTSINLKQEGQPQTPESPCSQGMCGDQRFQALHVSSNTALSSPARRMDFLLSKTSSAKPCEACHAMWQCTNQTPGLSSLNAMARYPPAGRVAVSRRGGLTMLKESIVPSHAVLVSWARIQKSCL